MTITIICFASVAIFTIVDQVILSKACKRVKKYGTKISKAGEFLLVKEVSAWSKINELAKTNHDAELLKLAGNHKKLSILRITGMILMILSFLYTQVFSNNAM